MDQTERNQNPDPAATAKVRSFYERMPYPAPLTNLDDFRDLYRNPERRRALFHLVWPARELGGGREILIAGCGTGKHAVRFHPEAGRKHPLPVKRLSEDAPRKMPTIRPRRPGEIAAGRHLRNSMQLHYPIRRVFSQYARQTVGFRYVHLAHAKGPKQLADACGSANRRRGFRHLAEPAEPRL